jgi:hypothetical protein
VPINRTTGASHSARPPSRRPLLRPHLLATPVLAQRRRSHVPLVAAILEAAGAAHSWPGSPAAEPRAHAVRTLPGRRLHGLPRLPPRTDPSIAAIAAQVVSVATASAKANALQSPRPDRKERAGRTLADAPALVGIVPGSYASTGAGGPVGSHAWPFHQYFPSGETAGAVPTAARTGADPDGTKE